MKKLIFTVILALFLTACGQTGKLVLPSKMANAQQS
ncbi:MAG: lipoprotein [Methylococcales bacterium]|nr:lipoprotein [Methylococcales bacterium]MDD5755132.1 lipoprotein [Methylococcales bacterium]